MATDVVVDRAANEAYVSDGYRNRRVIVYDADSDSTSGTGAPTVTNPTTPTSAHMIRMRRWRTSSVRSSIMWRCRPTGWCMYAIAKRSDPGLPEGRYFRKGGLFREENKGFGTVFDVTFSKDPKQTYLYNADGSNNRINIVLRETLEVLTNFGDGGRQPGQFFAVHNIAADSKGNVYSVETQHGQRVQKFLYRGMGPVGSRSRAWCGRKQRRALCSHSWRSQSCAQGSSVEEFFSGCYCGHLSVLPAGAQGVGAISGTITDNSDAVMPGYRSRCRAVKERSGRIGERSPTNGAPINSFGLYPVPIS